MSVRRKSSQSSANPTNTAVNVTADDWSAAELLGGKSAADLQENIAIDDTLETIAGTLHYVTGYTQFSGTVSEQSGHYLAVKIDSDATLSIKDTADGEYTALDSSGIAVIRITDKSAQKLYIKAELEAQMTEFVYDLSGLTLEPEE